MNWESVSFSPSISVSPLSEPGTSRLHRRPILGVSLTFTMLISTCVFITIAVCSPHHRIRHGHGHGIGHHLHEHHVKNDTTATGEPQPKDNAKVNRGPSPVPPAYLMLMYESLALASHSLAHSKSLHRRPVSGGDSEEQQHAGTSHTEPIVRAMLPAQIRHSVVTRINYPLSRKGLGDFNRANIILTLRDEVNLSDDGSVLTIVVSIKEYQATNSLTIREGSKFYSFDVTKLIKQQMTTAALDLAEGSESASGDEVETLGIECTITDTTVTGRSRQFSEIFDTDTEAPFILLRFQDIHLSAGAGPGLGRTSHHHEDGTGVKDTEHWVIGQSHRRKRSAPTPSAATATGIPGIGMANSSPSSSAHTNGECTCPNHVQEFPFLPQLAAGTSTSASLTAQNELNASTQQRERDDEYEVTPMNSLTANITVPVPNSSDNKSNSRYAEDGVSRYSYSHNSVSRKHQAIAKLTLSEPRSQGGLPPPHPSKVPTSPTVCKRHDWLVRPIDISLMNVIRPEYLDLGFCGGTCPFPLQNDVFNFTLHSYFVDQHRFYNGFATPSNVPHARCIPVTYKKLMVLTKEPDGGFAMIVYDDASVESCGCR